MIVARVIMVNVKCILHSLLMFYVAYIIIS